MAEITMPQLGETVTEGTITKWFKQVGDAVAEDEPLYEVSTDKVDSEVPAPMSGTLTEIKVAEGETVDVGVVLAVIGEAGSTPVAPPPQADPPATRDDPAPAAAEAAVDDRAPVPEGGSDPSTESEAGAALPPVPAASAGPVTQPAPARAPSDVATSGHLLSPVVRRLVAENGLDPSSISGTGVGGRITRNDVLAAAKAANGARTPQPATPRAAGPAVPAPAPSSDRDTVIPHTNIRRRTAEHMVRSLDTSAHVHVTIEVDYEGVDRVRRVEGDEWRAEEGFGLTYLPFVARAVADAIHEYPEVNATFTDGALVVHNYLNLGIAVDLDFKGLMVPVVRDADTKRMRAIAREIRDLAARARSKKLTPDDITGGTFTITNPGPFGTLITMPIINQPQVAILSTDGVKRRPVVIAQADGGEAIAIHSVGNLVLGFDHRAFDGAYASAFLHRVKELLETRDWSAEL